MREKLEVVARERLKIVAKEGLIEERVETFVPISQTEFESRRVEIKSDEMSVYIPGREGDVLGRSLVSENINNPKPLEIVVEGELRQDPFNPKILFLEEGTISIGGEKRFEALERFERSKGALERLPIRDPDLTRVGEMEFRQTGTLQIKARRAFIYLS